MTRKHSKTKTKTNRNEWINRKNRIEKGPNVYLNQLNFSAEIYAAGQAEIMLGKALKTLNVKRSDVVISTKLIKGGPGPNDWG